MRGSPDGRRMLCLLLLIGAACLFATAIIDQSFAQGGPFGVRPPARAPAGAPAAGLLGWVAAKQSEFYRALSGLIRAAGADGTAPWALFGLSFLYGIFHAVGPGHGKAVISSYLVASDETWRRGITLSFASALLQSLVAIAIVGVAAALLGATARMMCSANYAIEIASYALIAAVGARLLWVKGRAFLASFQTIGRPLTQAGAAVTHHHDHDHHDHHDHVHGHDHHHHEHDAACGHAHGPDPADLAGPGGWRRGLSAIVAVGVRPCSGAIVVLVFALGQGLFWAGVGATLLMGLGTAVTVAAIATAAVAARGFASRLAASRPGYGAVALRGIEVAAAGVVLLFGLVLLAGYMVTERIMFC
ncbi:MAG TPA: nickel transporter [Xanthobacteraceae bacterium]|nr:nickel transporter [Xanthobacteraceae bacterium]